MIKVEKKDNKINIFYDKGQDFNQGFVKISDTLSKELKYDKIFFTKNIDSIKKSINQYFIDKGFAFSRVKTKYAGNRELFPIMELSIIKENKRKIDNFVLKGYEKVPKRFIKNLEKQFLGQDYNAKTLLSIHQALKNHQFIGLEKTPQTLFTKDFTSVFLFTQKKKANYFDGIVGFGNDRTEKLSFNGTLNLQFRNIFNAFESISFYWQRNADKGQTFDLEVDIPYVMKSNLGIDMKINIFRQDSSFANAKILPSVYYHIHNSQKIGLRGTLETSSVINQLYASGKDYNKQGLGFWYEYSLPTDIELFIDKIKLRAEADWFSVKYAEGGSAK
ncbi:MAG: hypothetical protein Q4C75_05820, partial [Bergeyella zoohelcum]|nr:hypothetical protein [Bergeyella zoohelcum]